MPLVAEMKSAHLLNPAGLAIHVGLDSFLEHGLFRGARPLSLMTVFHDLILLASSWAAWGVRDTCVNDGTPLDDDTIGLKLAVDFGQEFIIKAGLHQCVAEAAHRRTVGSAVFHAQPYEAAEGETVIQLFFHFAVTQSIQIGRAHV